MKTTRLFSVIMCGFLLIHLSSADDGVSLRTIGMGRAAVSTSRGIDAIGVNPANIAIPDIGHFDFNLINTNIRVSTELFSYDDYMKYFTGRDSIDANGNTKRVPYLLTDQDKAYLMSQIPDNPVTRINVEEMWAGFSFQNKVLGGVGFAIIDHAGERMAFSKDFFDLVYLEGLPSNTTYIFNGTSFEAWWYREYNLSYGRKLPVKIPFLKDLYVGAGLKIIEGYGIFETTKNNSSLQNNSSLSATNPNTLIGNFDYAAERTGVDFFNDDSVKQPFMVFPAPVGTGTGFDIGASAELLSGIQIALSVTDIGSITWDKNIIQTARAGQIIFTGFSSTIGDSVKDMTKGINQPGENFTTSLPTVLRMGASAEAGKIPFLKFLPGHLLLAFEYAQGLNESLGNTTKPRFSIGSEYRIIPFLPLRTGFLIGGDDHLRWSFGFGLGSRNVSLDFATDNFGMFFTPKDFQVISLSMGFRVRI